MRSIEIFAKPTIELAKSSRAVRSGIQPTLNNHVSSIYAPKLGAEVSMLLRGGNDKPHLSNALASYTPDFICNIKSIWKAFEKAAERNGDATGEFQAAIIGGLKGENCNPLAQDSEHLFYELVEGCYKNGYDYTAIGLKSPKAELDTVYVTPSGIYLQNNDFKQIFTEKKLHEYTNEEVEQLLSGVYDYIEVSKNHSILAGDRLNFIRKN